MVISAEQWYRGEKATESSGSVGRHKTISADDFAKSYGITEKKSKRISVEDRTGGTKKEKRRGTEGLAGLSKEEFRVEIERRKQERLARGEGVSASKRRVTPTLGGKILRAPVGLGARFAQNIQQMGRIATAHKRGETPEEARLRSIVNKAGQSRLSRYLGDIRALGQTGRGPVADVLDPIGAGAEVVSYMPMARIPTGAVGLAKGLGRASLKEMNKRALPLAGEGAAAGFLESTGRQLQEGKFRPGEIAAHTGFGGVAGQTLGVGGQLVGRLAGGARKQAVEPVQDFVQRTAKEAPEEGFKEARKFKSAEEFLKSRGEPIYHGTNEKFDVFDPRKIGSRTDAGFYGKGFYFGNSKEFAQVAASGRPSKQVMEVYPISKNFFEINKVASVKEMANLLDMSEDALFKDSSGVVRPKMDSNLIASFTSKLRDLGYDGVVVRRGSDAVETVIFDSKNLKTKQQLIDIWNKEQKTKTRRKTPAQRQVEETTRIVPTVGTSKLAKGVKSKAVKNKLIYGFDKRFRDLPEYDKVNRKEQMSKITEFVLNDTDNAVRVAMGEIEPPPNMLPEGIFTAVEDYATAMGDIDTLHKLATKSKLVGEATLMGQRISMLAERSPHSVVSMSKKLGAERKAQAQRRLKAGKDVEQVASKLKQEKKARLEVEIARAKLKGDLTNYLDEITC